MKIQINIRLAILLTIFSSLNSFGQKKHSEKELIENSKCIHTNRYSVSERLAFYPFDVAAKITFISFDDPKLDENVVPISNRTLIAEKVKEIVLLDKKQIISFTDLLYNYGQNNKFPKYGIENYKCYNPRNAVVFFDEKDEIIEYIEICFQCQRIKLSSEKIKSWPECAEKLELVKKYMLNLGIEVGITFNLEP